MRRAWCCSDCCTILFSRGRALWGACLPEGMGGRNGREVDVVGSMLCILIFSVGELAIIAFT